MKKGAIIALTGKMGSGKTTALNIIKKSFEGAGAKVKVLKFAAPLYDLQTTIYKQLGFDTPENLKDRKLLQVLGTDWGREKDPNIWVNQWKRAVDQALSEGYDVVITDDCRFPNEAEAVREYDKGIVLKMVGEQRGEHVSNTGHASELGIDAINADYDVNNNGALDTLDSKLRHSIHAALMLKLLVNMGAA